ncbi:aminoglycoside phosphotransferase family protein [Micromonospora sp. WMMD1102]|uniref:aminoglycoside phosphotransferase family protein n=1 Tax=Micromonospora sp. WMMD1102 TaxID=3016105 RepID=UPI002414D1F3|nr:aminoglycoside phosphotransferase family protein [Micromonospora sp. WMMD1102]MDG4788961.1 aminoglycoside phosphotransferase family protein [Micromonospora sp. WMMD1102]
MDSVTSFVPLSAAEGGPSSVVRTGQIVRRAARPWTRTVHALLHHLEEVGFTGSPWVVGTGTDGDGNEMLTYVEGEIVHPRAWTDEGIWQVGRLLRDLHAATASFRPPPGAVWQPWWMHREGPDSVIGHCDAGPWHIVARAGRPVAFVDWTLAGPVDRLDEVVGTAWWNAQLHDDDIAERHQLPAPADRARQLRLFLDGYELPAADRVGLVDRMVEFAVRDCAAEAARARITPESTDPTPLWALAWRARAAGWMIRHRTLLERAVSGG